MAANDMCLCRHRFVLASAAHVGYVWTVACQAMTRIDLDNAWSMLHYAEWQQLTRASYVQVRSLTR